MDTVFQFIALGLWSLGCIMVGAVLGYLFRYTTERKDSKPICYGKSGGCTGKGANTISRNSSQAQRHAAAARASTGHTSDAITEDDQNSNLGFEVMSDDAEPAPPVPSTPMPPPAPAPGPQMQRRRGFMERGANIPLFYTDTPGTRIHTRADCRGLRTVQEGGHRVKMITTKSTCALCCNGVEVLP